MIQTFSKLRLNLNAFRIVINLARCTSGSFSYRFNVMKKYYFFYIYHKEQQQRKIKSNIEYLNKQREQKTYENQIKSVYKNYTQKIKTKSQQTLKNIGQKQKSEYEKQMRSLLHHGIQYLSLYYQSLQNIIQGRRQVLHDQKYKFEDGQSVDEKRIIFQMYFNRLLGRKKQQMQSLEEQYQKKKIYQAQNKERKSNKKQQYKDQII